MDNNGQDTIRILATAAGRGKDMTNTIGTIERTYGWKADAALQPNQVRRVNNFLANGWRRGSIEPPVNLFVDLQLSSGNVFVDRMGDLALTARIAEL